MTLGIEAFFRKFGKEPGRVISGGNTRIQVVMLRNHRLIWLLSFIFCVNCCEASPGWGFSQGDEPELLKEIENAWSIVLKHLGGDVSFELEERNLSTSPPEIFRIEDQYSDGQFVHILKPSSANGLLMGQAWFVNKQYSCYVEPCTLDAWQVLKLIPRTNRSNDEKSQIELDCDTFRRRMRNQFFRLTLGDDFVLPDVFDNSTVRNLRVFSSVGDNPSQVNLTFTRRVNTAPNAIDFNFRVELDRNTHFLPTNVSFHSTAVNGDASGSGSIVFDDFRSTGQLTLPHRWVLVSRDGGNLVQSFETKVANIRFGKIANDQFRLGRFGLPEPDFVSNSPSWMIRVCGILIGVLILWASSAFFRARSKS